MQAGKIKEMTRHTALFDLMLFQIDFSSLAKVSDGYCTAQIIDVIQNTLDETRLNLTKRRKVKGEEFMTLLAKEEPLYKEKEDAYSSWCVFLIRDLRTCRSACLQKDFSAHDKPRLCPRFPASKVIKNKKGKTQVVDC